MKNNNKILIITFIYMLNIIQCNSLGKKGIADIYDLNKKTKKINKEINTEKDLENLGYEKLKNFFWKKKNKKYIINIKWKEK